MKKKVKTMDERIKFLLKSKLIIAVLILQFVLLISLFGFYLYSENKFPFEPKYEVIKREGSKALLMDFDESEIVTVPNELKYAPEEIKNDSSIGKIPLTNFVLIYFIDEPHKELYPCGRNSNGCYILEEDIIFIKNFGYPDNMTETFAHEMGHFFYHRALKYAEKEEWKELSENDKSEPVSDYAEESVNEDFAENFEAYFFYREKMSPLKLEFMKRMLTKYTFFKE